MREALTRLRQALPTLPATFVWFAAVACLVVLPAVVGSLRTTSYEASTRLIVHTKDRRVADQVEHVKAVVADPGISHAVTAEYDQLIHPGAVPERITVASKGRWIELTATGETPAQARDLTNAAGAVLERASGYTIFPIRHAVAPAPDASVDRLLARLPGPIPNPPHPIFSAAVGFLVALLLYVEWRRRFEGDRPGGAG